MDDLRAIASQFCNFNDDMLLTITGTLDYLSRSSVSFTYCPYHKLSLLNITDSLLHRGPKKRATRYLFITLRNVGRFKKKFH